MTITKYVNTESVTQKRTRKKLYDTYRKARKETSIMRLLGQNQYTFLIDGVDKINQLRWYFSDTTAGPSGLAAGPALAVGNVSAICGGLQIREVKKSGKKQP